MFRLRIFCNDGDKCYWENGNGTYETYQEALLACYGNSIQEVNEFMHDNDSDIWWETNEYFEVTDTYMCQELEGINFFPVATVSYDHAPNDRENDCDIQIVTGYYVVELGS